MSLHQKHLKCCLKNSTILYRTQDTFQHEVTILSAYHFTGTGGINLTFGSLPSIGVGLLTFHSLYFLRFSRTADAPMQLSYDRDLKKPTCYDNYPRDGVIIDRNLSTPHPSSCTGKADSMATFMLQHYLL